MVAFGPENAAGPSLKDGALGALLAMSPDASSPRLFAMVLG